MSEKRGLKINHDTIKNKIVIQYENSVEIDPEAALLRMKRLTSQIAQMELHCQQITADIESAKKELSLLQQLSDSMGIAKI